MNNLLNSIGTARDKPMQFFVLAFLYSLYWDKSGIYLTVRGTAIPSAPVRGGDGIRQVEELPRINWDMVRTASHTARISRICLIDLFVWFSDFRMISS